MMSLTGFPDPDPPVKATPWTADYITALFCLWSSLAGYIYAQRTGTGQVIDLAQYEAIHHVLAGTMVAYYELGIVRERSGNKAGLFQPYDTYQAKDGWVIIAAVGTVFDRVCRVLDLDPTEERWRIACTQLESPEGIEFDAILRGWVEERSVSEVVSTLNAAQVGCCTIMTPENTTTDPHYEMRNVHVEWEDLQLGRVVKGTGICPKFSTTPGKYGGDRCPLATTMNWSTAGSWVYRRQRCQSSKSKASFEALANDFVAGPDWLNLIGTSQKGQIPEHINWDVRKSIALSAPLHSAC